MATYMLTDVETRKGREFKADFEEGCHYRVAFPWLAENGQIFIEAVEFHRRFDSDDVPESERIRVSFRLPEGVSDEVRRKIEKVCGSSKVRYVTPVLIYTTQKSGEVVKSAIGAYELKLWVFAGDALRQLQGIHSDFPLGKIDVDLFCKDRFKNVQLIPKSGSLLHSKEYGGMFDKEKLGEELKVLIGSIKDAVALEYSEVQILYMLGIDRGDSGVGGGDEFSGNNIDDDDVPF
jgi:hypothetical protein